jgi:protein gp37
MSNIEWTDKTLNFFTGCNKVSPGCKNCYAEGVAKRFWGDRPFTEVEFHPDRLEQPYKWKKGYKIFVNSMSDFFHPAITNGQRDRCMAAMLDNPRHTFQILTKRPEAMRRYLDPDQRYTAREMSQWSRWEVFDIDMYWPLSNVWWGVSVEDQIRTNRIPHLLASVAAIRFLSCEPLLGPLDLTSWLPSLDWVIVGGESGPGARPCHAEWIYNIMIQCQRANVACFVKQTGSNFWHGGRRMDTPGKGGDPDWLRRFGLLVREFPFR